jgi:hypothetical protein
VDTDARRDWDFPKLLTGGRETGCSGFQDNREEEEKEKHKEEEEEEEEDERERRRRRRRRRATTTRGDFWSQ